MKNLKRKNVLIVVKRFLRMLKNANTAVNGKKGHLRE
jgi:hypothetical protein